MPSKHKIFKEVKKTILKYNMVRPGERIVIAVSGGPDSICLMDILADLSREMDTGLVIAHYEHGLRPEEDTCETELVRGLSDSLNLSFETEKASGLDPHLPSLEEKARELRYAFLERVREKYSAQKIAMGHNLNDQAETVLMRLLRGSGMTGLSGIPPVRDNTVIRPLIETGREDIIDYLEHRNLKYATDSSNNDSRFLRNKIRLELMPEMEKYQPEIIMVLGKLAENLRYENSLFESQAEKWVDERLAQDKTGNYYLDINSLKDLPDAFIRRIVRNIVKRHYKSLYAIDYDHIQAIIALMSNEKPNITIDLPGDLIVKKEYNRLIFTSQISEPGSFTCKVKGRGSLYIHEIGKTIMIEELYNNPRTEISNDTNTAFLDGDLLPYPLTIRDFKAGDRFVPFGMKGHKKVKDFFIDLKIPPAVRKQTPILLKDDNIAWICGYRIDDRYKVTANTKKILKITIS